MGKTFWAIPGFCLYVVGTFERNYLAQKID